MLARLGQQRAFTTNAFVNVTPRPTRSRCTVGIAPSVSKRWSSVRTKTMFGRVAAAAPLTAESSATPTMSSANMRWTPPRTPDMVFLRVTELRAGGGGYDGSHARLPRFERLQAYRRPAASGRIARRGDQLGRAVRD